jgi:hypothetical protein
VAGSKTVNLLDLQPGMRVALANGATAEVVDNPQDGMWVICNYLTSPNNPKLVGAGEQPVFAPDIVSVEGQE